MTKLDELRADLAEVKALLTAFLVEARELHFQLERARHEAPSAGMSDKLVEQYPQPASVTYNHLIPRVVRAPTYGQRIPTVSSDDYLRWSGQLAPPWQREEDNK